MKATILENVEQATCNKRNTCSYVTAVVHMADMSGFGITTALMGLTTDADLREKFSTGGIYIQLVVKDASPGNFDLRL